MGLHKCPDCGNKVSNTAAACPKCGRPVEGGDIPQEPSGLAKAIGALVVLLVVVIIFADKDDDRPMTTSRQATQSRTTTPTRSYAAVYPKSTANLRAGPSTKHEIVGTGSAGERLEYLSKSGSWYRLRPGTDSTERWVHESVVETEATRNYRRSAKLVIHEWSWSKSYSYVTAEGMVTNQSNQSLSNVTALVSFFDASGGFITSDTGIIEYNPILPGQTSPWKVMVRYNPAMKSARVEFKELFGGTIASYPDY